MNGSHRFIDENPPACFRQCRADERKIENVMVEAAHLRIAQRSRAKLHRASGAEIAAEVVQREDLLQMCLVRFRRGPVEVRTQVRQSGDRAGVIE